MGKLRSLLLAASLAWSVPANAQGVPHWRPYVVEASERFGIPVAWIEAVMRAESGGRTHAGGRPIRSSAGAIGLMQLMPGTWAQMRARPGLGTDPHHPRDNILAGTLYLRLMYDRFGYPGLFGAYNAGPARYAEHLSGRRRLPNETVGYLASVAPGARAAPIRQATPRPQTFAMGLFVIRRQPSPDAAAATPEAASSSLFIPLSRAE
jgi:soluble lytic murein transglycosylase-like protein